MSRRYFIAIGVPECPHLDLPTLPNVALDIARMAGLLTDECQGYQRILADEIPLGATSAQIRAALFDWFGDRAQRREDDYVVVYYAGHGDADGSRFDQHCLLTADTRDGRPDTVIRSEEFADFFFNGSPPRPQNVLLILDSCYAGKGSAEIIRRALTSPRILQRGAGFWILASTGPDSIASDGAFVDALAAKLADTAWMPVGGTQFLSPNDIAISASEWFSEQGRQQQAHCYMINGGRQTPQFLRNPRFTQATDGWNVADMGFWHAKASGADTAGSKDWFFSGRRAALDKLLEWLAAPHPVQSAVLVTGLPGSGKSAVLSWLVLMGGADARQTHPTLGGAIHVHLRAIGESLSSLTHKLASLLGMAGAAPTPEQLIADMRAAGRRWTVLIDGLDEAPEAMQIERRLLQGLTDCPGVRLIVGSRRRGSRTPLEGRAMLIDLDAAEYFDARDVADYIYARLTTDSRYDTYRSPSTHHHARALADYIAEGAGPSFLYARLLSRAVLGMAAVVDTSQPDWRKQIALPADLDDAFEQDLARFDEARRRRIIDLLVPLAYARGSGLPRKNVWYTVANHIVGAGQYRNSDIRELLDEAAYYVVQDSQHGDTVFRLFHQTFADYLRKVSQHDDVEQSFYSALLEIAQAGNDRLDFAVVDEPYLKYHFAAHAAAVGKLDLWMADLGFLGSVPPDVLLPELARLRTQQGAAIARAYRMACHWQRSENTQAFFSYLALSCCQRGLDSLLTQIASRGDDFPWLPEAAFGAAELTAQVFARGENRITALAVSRNTSGQPVALCGYETGELVVWNLQNDKVLLSVPHPATPSSTQAGLGGRAVSNIEYVAGAPDAAIVVSWQDQLLAVYQVSEDWELAGAPTVVSAPVKLMCVAQCDGETVLATSGDHDVSTWSLADLRRLHHVPQASRAIIYGLAPFLLDGEQLLATVNDTVRRGKQVEDAALCLWNLRGLVPVLRAGHDQLSGGFRVHASSVAGAPRLLVSGYTEHVFIFDPRNGEASQLEHYYSLGRVLYQEPEVDKTTLVGCLYGRIVTATLTVQDEDGGATLLSYAPDMAQVGSDMCRVTPGDGRDDRLLVAARDQQLHVYRLGEVLAVAGEGNEFERFFLERRICSAVHSGGLYVLCDSDGGVSGWNGAGQRIWLRDQRHDTILCLAVCVQVDPELIFAATQDGRLLQLSRQTGADMGAATRIGDKPIAFQVRLWRGLPLAFVIVRAADVYVVRVWNLSDGQEVICMVDEEGPGAAADVASRVFEFDDDEIRWAFQLEGYYKTKPMHCSSEVIVDGRCIVLLGGPHGEVRAVDYQSFSEIDCWTCNSKTHASAYIHALAALERGGMGYVLSGNDSGDLCLHRMRSVPNTQSPLDDLIAFRTAFPNVLIEEAHRGSITSIVTYDSGDRAFFVSAANDGIVCVWTLELQLLDTIEIGFPLVGLQVIGDEQLLIATASSVIMLRMNWKAWPGGTLAPAEHRACGQIDL
jgi:WD40 repeat protein